MRFLPLEQMIAAVSRPPVPGLRGRGQGMFRVLRDSEVEIEEEAEDLVRLFELALKRRRRGHVIRLPSKPACPTICAISSSSSSSVAGRRLRARGPARPRRHQAADHRRAPDLHLHALQCRAFPSASAISAAIASPPSAQKDIIVHHPYESFDVVVQFVRQAARDPAVVAIKQTLYRTSDDSPIVARADRGGRGRQVGDRAGRAQGALRRGGEHPLGARSRARRRAGGLRLPRAQDPRQGVAGGAARGAARCAPTSISAPATITPTPPGFTPICSSSPAIRRCAATPRGCSTT